MTKEKSTKPGSRAGSSKSMDLKKRKQYGFLRDEHGTMPRINQVTNERENPMSLKKAAESKLKKAKEKERLKKMDKVGIIKLIQVESKRNPMSFAKKVGKGNPKEKLKKMNKNGLINFIMDLKNKMKTGEDKIPERLKANKGGMIKKKGMAKGRAANAGASVPPNRKARK